MTNKPHSIHKKKSSELTKVQLEYFINDLALKVLNECLLREYESEMKEYKIHKKISNLICDMGFIINDASPDTDTNSHHRLFKRT